MVVGCIFLLFDGHLELAGEDSVEKNWSALAFMATVASHLGRENYTLRRSRKEAVNVRAILALEPW